MAGSFFAAAHEVVNSLDGVDLVIIDNWEADNWEAMFWSWEWVGSGVG